tara:strand:- start:265 stop:654 length:390 start_codon:yes stop_codon:yes gene_type:complete
LLLVVVGAAHKKAAAAVLEVCCLALVCYLTQAPSIQLRWVLVLLAQYLCIQLIVQTVAILHFLPLRLLAVALAIASVQAHLAGVQVAVENLLLAVLEYLDKDLLVALDFLEVIMAAAVAAVHPLLAQTE